MKDKMMVMTSWLETLETIGLTDEQIKEAYYMMLQYGCYSNYIVSDDPILNAALGFIYPQIDNMQESYESKSVQGKKGGRKSKLDQEKIWELAHGGMTAKAIGEQLGVAPTTISSSKAWRQRFNETLEL